MKNWISYGTGAPGIERVQAHLHGPAFDPHRHDCYAIGITTRGIQTFDYRGEPRRSLPGCLFVLHPDETHDGRAGDEFGFAYRTLYIQPSLVLAALDRIGTLPFVPKPVSQDPRLAQALAIAFTDFQTPLQDVQRDHLTLMVSDALAAADPSIRRHKTTAVHAHGVDQARAFLDAQCTEPVHSEELERVSDLSRYTLARHFRARLGISPYQYLIGRRLSHVRWSLRAGRSLSESAFAAGFADQSHMTRHFTRNYGMTPGRWASMVVS